MNGYWMIPEMYPKLKDLLKSYDSNLIADAQRMREIPMPESGVLEVDHARKSLDETIQQMIEGMAIEGVPQKIDEYLESKLPLFSNL